MQRDLGYVYDKQIRGVRDEIDYEGNFKTSNIVDNPLGHIADYIIEGLTEAWNVYKRSDLSGNLSEEIKDLLNNWPLESSNDVLDKLTAALEKILEKR